MSTDYQSLIPKHQKRKKIYKKKLRESIIDFETETLKTRYFVGVFRINNSSN